MKILIYIQHMEDDKNPCYGFMYTGSTMGHDIIKDLKINKKEFSRWKKFKSNSNEIVVLTPNFTIDKFMLHVN